MAEPAQAIGPGWAIVIVLVALLAGAAVAVGVGRRRLFRRAGRDRGDELRGVIDALPLIVYARDADGRFTLANRAAAEAFGTTPEGMIGRTGEELGRTGETLQEGLEQERQARQTGQAVVGVTETLVWPDGSAHWLQTARIPCRRDDGTATSVMSVSVDLTEQKQAEDALKQSEAAMQGLLLAAPIGIGLITEDTLGWTNQQVSDMTGYPRAELMGRPLRLLFAADAEYERVSRQCAALERGGGVSLETRLRRRDGAIVDVLWSCTQLRHAGVATSMVFTAVDITEQKQAQAALLASRQYNRALFDQSTMGLVVSRLDGRIQDANPAFAGILGLSADEAMKLTFTAITPGEAHPVMQAQCDRLARVGRYGPVESVLRHKDGRAVPVRMAGQVLERAGEAFVLSSVEDITERRRLEEQLRHAQKMEAVGQLAGGVAHDFNNQLTVIQGYSDLLLRGVRPQDALHTPLQEIRRAADRAKRLTSQLLAFSRKQVLRPEVLDMRQVLTDMGHSLGRIVGERVELSLNLPPRLDPVKVDRGQLEQALINLVLNARDAMPEGGRLIIEANNVHLTRRYTNLHPETKPGEYVALTVSDTGQGMDEMTSRHAFDPFYTTKEVGKGTGLGLSMVYGFVQQSGGTISLYSEVGKGTTFRLYFPITAEERVGAAAPEPTMLAKGHETVLVVEDEDSVRQFAMRVLRQCGYSVLGARQAGEALAAVERHQGAIDLLVTDIVMPGITGLELAERIRAVRPEVKVLYMTGYAPSAVTGQGDIDVTSNLLVKPFSPELLSQMVRHTLDHVTPAV